MVIINAMYYRGENQTNRHSKQKQIPFAMLLNFFLNLKIKTIIWQNIKQNNSENAGEQKLFRSMEVSTRF